RLLTSKSHQLIRETDIELRSYGWNRYVHHDINACYHTGFTGPMVIFHNDRAMILLAHRVHPSREDHGYLKQREALIQSFLHEKKK
ncbi:serine hydrolase, partial [Erysipelothrix rhusiopathiae]|nr:serine hydrolase [Erysipelothrix rhusiopathiae]